MLHRLLAACLPYVPTPIMRRLSAKYISGEELSDALGRVEELKRLGFPSVLDLLGEEVAHAAAADAACEEYIRASRELAARNIDSYVSIKPTHLGLTLDEEACFARYSRVAEVCSELKLRVRVEMEDVRFTDSTLALYRRLRADYANVGIVLQARLFRTPDDIAALSDEEHDVRLVKGVYLEPKEIAHTEPAAITNAYLACAAELLKLSGPLSFATHDDLLIDRLASAIEAADDPPPCEIQVLDGVRPSYWERWRAAGHVVRVYVPYGPDWRAYSIRRMRKNPQMFRAVTRSMLFGD